MEYGLLICKITINHDPSLPARERGLRPYALFYERIPSMTKEGSDKKILFMYNNVQIVQIKERVNA